MVSIFLYKKSCHRQLFLLKMGRNKGVEPLHNRATICRVNPFTNSAIHNKCTSILTNKLNKINISKTKFTQYPKSYGFEEWWKLQNIAQQSRKTQII